MCTEHLIGMKQPRGREKDVVDSQGRSVSGLKRSVENRVRSGRCVPAGSPPRGEVLALGSVVVPTMGPLVFILCCTDVL